MTKKSIIFIFTMIFFLVLYINKEKNETIVPTFNQNYNDYYFDNYYILFNECVLNTDNFIAKLSYFNNKDYKILEIVPYINESFKPLFINKKFLFYSKDLKQILNKFKNEYINVITDSNYINNVCIKSIRINTAYIYYKEFKSKF